MAIRGAYYGDEDDDSCCWYDDSDRGVDHGGVHGKDRDDIKTMVVMMARMFCASESCDWYSCHVDACRSSGNIYSFTAVCPFGGLAT